MFSRAVWIINRMQPDSWSATCSASAAPSHSSNNKAGFIYGALWKIKQEINRFNSALKYTIFISDISKGGTGSSSSEPCVPSLSSWWLKLQNSLILDVWWKRPFRCCDCVGESGSLSTNPSESHLCFSLAHLWPFSSSLVPNLLPVKSWRGEGVGGWMKREREWEREREREGTFSSGCFLWFVFVNVSKPRGLAGPFSTNTGGQAHYLFLTDH